MSVLYNLRTDSVGDTGAYVICVPEMLKRPDDYFFQLHKSACLAYVQLLTKNDLLILKNIDNKNYVFINKEGKDIDSWCKLIFNHLETFKENQISAIYTDWLDESNLNWYQTLKDYFKDVFGFTIIVNLPINQAKIIKQFSLIKYYGNYVFVSGSFPFSLEKTYNLTIEGKTYLNGYAYLNDNGLSKGNVLRYLEYLLKDTKYGPSLEVQLKTIKSTRCEVIFSDKDKYLGSGSLFTLMEDHHIEKYMEDDMLFYDGENILGKAITELIRRYAWSNLHV